MALPPADEDDADARRPIRNPNPQPGEERYAGRDENGTSRAEFIRMQFNHWEMSKLYCYILRQVTWLKTDCTLYVNRLLNHLELSEG